jgi:hypothetical protein
MYLVADPDDSLLAASRATSPGRPPGLPSAAADVQRLEPQWYAVTFYTDSDWNRCPG